MTFNSFEFILLLLPLSVLLYFLVNKINFTLGKIVLLISSVIFYLSAGIEACIVMTISLLLNYIFSVLISKSNKFNKLFMFIPVVINICLLLYYKYYNFNINNLNLLFKLELPVKELLMPLGVSFYTFQQIAYIVGIYNKDIKDNNLLDYLIFILYFPKILMGPLMDPVDFNNQLNDGSKKKVSWDNIAYGLKIFSFGLFKKVMLADVFAKAVSWGSANFEILSSIDSLLIILSYTFEIYFDFSGYSDMATGVSLMLNIELPQNFNSPYKALSIRDFWKRWHMSLTKFFTKYVYIPLGGSRKGKLFTWINTLIVFLISGLWHGSHWRFVLWGLFNGLLSLFDREFEPYLKKIWKPLRWLLSFIIINILWSLFSSNGIHEWITTLTRIFTLSDLSLHKDLINVFATVETSLFKDIIGINYIVNNFKLFWALLYLLVSFVVCLCFENNYNNLKKNSYLYMVLSAVAFIWSFICIGGESVFVYFGF